MAYELPRTGDSPVVFDGELITSATTPGGPSDRRFELTAYLRTAGGPPLYVVAIAYLPPPARQRERESHWVLLCDTARDVGPQLAAWRRATPVADLLTNFPPAAQFAAKKAHLATLLDGHLGAAITALLSRIPGTETRL